MSSIFIFVIVGFLASALFFFIDKKKEASYQAKKKEQAKKMTEEIINELYENGTLKRIYQNLSFSSSDSSDDDL